MKACISRVKACAEENDELHKRIETLEKQNETLTKRLKKLNGTGQTQITLSQEPEFECKRGCKIPSRFVN